MLHRRTVPLVNVLVLLSATLCPHTVRAQTSDLVDQNFSQHLQQQRLYRLAGLNAERQLSRITDDDRARSQWIRELLTARSLEALEMSHDLAAPQWQQLDADFARWQAELRDDFARAEVDAKYEYVRYRRAKWMVDTANLDANRAETLGRAGGLLREISGRLRSLDDRLSQLIRDPSTRDSPALSVAAKRLQQQSKLLAGEVRLAHSQCYLPGSADATHLLSEADDHFKELARAVPPTEVSLTARLREAETQRRLGQFEFAQRYLASFPAELPADFDSQLRQVEEAELQIDLGRPQNSIELLNEPLQRPARAGEGEWRGAARLTVIRAYLALAEQSSKANADKPDSSVSRAYLSAAVRQIASLEQESSRYWVRRAEAMLASVGGNARLSPTESSSSPGDAEIDILSRSAANFFRRDQHSDAIVAYRKAAGLAFNAGQLTKSYDLAIKAAAILHQDKQHRDAVNEFNQIVDKYPREPRVAQADWLAILNSAQLLAKNELDVDSYTNHLRQHISRWPDDATSQAARDWLGRLLQQLGQDQEARDVWQAIPVTYDGIDGVLAQLRTSALQQWTRPLRPDDVGRFAQRSAHSPTSRHVRPAEDEVQHLRLYLQEIARSAKAAEKQGTHARAQLIQWEIELLFTDTPLAELAPPTKPATSLLSRQEQERLTMLRALQSALEQPAESRSEWREISEAQFDLVLPMLARLDREIVVQSATAPRQVSLATQQWRIVEGVNSKPAWQSNAQLLSFAGAALTRRGTPEPAIRHYEQLVDLEPKSAGHRLALAELNEALSSDIAVKTALDNYRRAARLCEEATPKWYQAKLGIARTLLNSGQRERAAESIQLLATLHPDLGGEPWHGEFQRILEKAQ
ncbi:MAG: hypothetical protein KDA92_09130 [Planctomycetales bacterium]|nr:hypothetical protein [Planctomycetales bacterium]